MNARLQVAERRKIKFSSIGPGFKVSKPIPFALSMPFSFSWLELFLSVKKTHGHLLFLCVAEYVGEDGDDPELVELGGQLRAEAQHPQAERQLVLDLKYIFIF
jgi:hypothetical protein